MENRMTGYHLSVGYISGYSGPDSKSEAWEVLKQIALAIADHPDKIVGEAAEEGDADLAVLREYAEPFRRREDATIKFCEHEYDGETIREVIMLASGGNPARTLKERIRRAFCRLVIREAHRRGMEVNLVVV